jgi:ribA/ribD-fused uncharacterized protein
MLPYDRFALRARIEAGERFEFLPFYGHTPTDAVGPWVFSQWAAVGFAIDGVRYATAEHWMMAEKARLFRDGDALAAILDAPGPREAKALGRQVSGFDEDTWKARRVDVVREGNLAKFDQDPALRAYLLGTAPRILVEAAPRDAIWGIGLGVGNPLVSNPARWRGANLLGFALTWVRDRLAASDR